MIQNALRFACSPSYLKKMSQTWCLRMERKGTRRREYEESEVVQASEEGGKKRLFLCSEHSSLVTVGASDT